MHQSHVVGITNSFRADTPAPVGVNRYVSPGSQVDYHHISPQILDDYNSLLGKYSLVKTYFLMVNGWFWRTYILVNGWLWMIFYGKWNRLNIDFSYLLFSRWWFHIFCIFNPIWGRFPFWLIFFKGVETTDQFLMIDFSRVFLCQKPVQSPSLHESD